MADNSLTTTTLLTTTNIPLGCGQDKSSWPTNSPCFYSECCPIKAITFLTTGIKESLSLFPSLLFSVGLLRWPELGPTPPRWPEPHLPSSTGGLPIQLFHALHVILHPWQPFLHLLRGHGKPLLPAWGLFIFIPPTAPVHHPPHLLRLLQ